MTGRLLLFGGTTEAREILERGIPAICSVVSDYGAELVRGLDGVEPLVGRLDSQAMQQLILAENITCVIDATHPYAAEVSKNINLACKNTDTPVLRVLRRESDMKGAFCVSSCRAAAEFLNSRPGRVLLTVGSKELREFTAVENYRERLYARVLPTSEVLRSCEELGFDPEHIIAMQGPFSAEMNCAMLKMLSASILVTKDGGAPGGAEAKAEGARMAGAELLLVARPQDSGCSVDEAVLWARRVLGLKRPPLFPVMTDIEGKTVLIAGGGAVASRRAEILASCGARLRVVSPEFSGAFPSGSELIKRPFETSDLDKAVLAVAATDDRDVNRLLASEAKKRGIPVSVADSAGEGTFFFPSLITHGSASASVSTAGLSPTLSRRLSDRLREVWSAWVTEDEKE